MSVPFYACCIAAPRSGEGKTMVAMSIMRLLTLRGMKVQGFKCGPDYIDPTFHSQATGRTSCNLDTWMMGAAGVRSLWASRVLNMDDAQSVDSTCVDAAICEGVMGLLDGKALSADHNAKKQEKQPFNIIGSTLDCARVLKLPVILVVNARGMASSMAALVDGFTNMAKRYDAHIVGIIANNVGSPRHANMLRTALKLAQLPPLLGTIPRCTDWSLPERQLGLVPQEELGEKSYNMEWLDNMVTAIEPHIDMDTLLAAIETPRPETQEILPTCTESKTAPKIMAIARDKAFCFYYDANLAALRANGWELIEFSPLADNQLPHCDAIYLGGGYPEEFAKELAANTSMRQSIQNFASKGGLVYAECGGYMALAKNLIDADGQSHEMFGLINGTARMGSRLRSLGYREFVLKADTPFAVAGTVIRGHEFHWSDMELHEDYAPLYTHNGQDIGIAKENIVAGYGHLYWAHLPQDEVAQPIDQIKQDRPSHKHPPKRGKLVIFNGPSSAGKSTLVALVQKKLHHLNFPTLSLSMDSFLKATSCGHENACEAMAHGDAVVQSLHGAASAAVMMGTSVLLDHVLGDDAAWYDDIMQRLDFTPYIIQVQCHLPELERRELQRNDRNPNLEHVRRQYASIHASVPTAFTVDTSEASPEACADLIIKEIIKYFQ